MTSTTPTLTLVTGGTGKTLDDLLEPGVQWKAHNYNHLHEAPTVFYAVALLLALIGQGDGLNATLGWAYVALRIVHSLVQATVNRVVVRFLVFALSSLVLIALIAATLMASSRVKGVCANAASSPEAPISSTATAAQMCTRTPVTMSSPRSTSTVGKSP